MYDELPRFYNMSQNFETKFKLKFFIGTLIKNTKRRLTSLDKQ